MPRQAAAFVLMGLRSYIIPSNKPYNCFIRLITTPNVSFYEAFEKLDAEASSLSDPARNGIWLLDDDAFMQVHLRGILSQFSVRADPAHPGGRGADRRFYEGGQFDPVERVRAV